MAKQKKSPPARPRTRSMRHGMPRKKKSPARRQQLMTAAAGPTPLVKLVSIQPNSPITIPCANFTVNATCRLAVGQTCGAILLDASAMQADVSPNGPPGGTATDPQFTFTLNTAGMTYGLQVFVVDQTSGQVLVSDGMVIMTQ